MMNLDLKLNRKARAFHKQLGTAILLAGAVFVFAGCTRLQQYRTAYAPCSTNDPVKCATAAIEETPDYLLGFVEFDDHGWLWDAKQMRAVLNRIYEEDAKQGLLIVVFAHGWKHNASFADNNVEAFRTVLSELQAVEKANSTKTSRPSRKVVGVYLGWRGLSQKMWGLQNVTFWERKRTAHNVGQGAVSELLVELDSLRKASHVLHKDDSRKVRQPTMLVVVGHSFGGAVVYSALAPLLEERLIDTLDSNGNARPPRGFGDLVMLINPAFEAAKFEVLRRSANERTYATNQPATLAIFTSKTDNATKVAFPAGRRFSTLFEKHRKDQPQYQANITAVGHYAPYITHDLNAVAPRATEAPRTKSAKPRSRQYTGKQTVEESAERVRILSAQVDNAAAKPKETLTLEDRTYHFSQSDLVPRKDHKLFNPFYVVSVDTKIIPNHSDIETEAFLSFLREFVLAFSGNR